MRLSPSRRNLGKLAAVLGILQGIAWAAMSLAAIILHNWAPDLDPQPNYTKLIGALLYSHFITGGNSTLGINFIIRPTDFTIFMWIYFLLSIGWFAVSVDQLTAIYLEKQRQTTIMIMWGTITLIVSLIDLIFVSLLARDYSACDEGITTDISGITIINTSCYLTIGIAMTVAARGYTLWILNLILSILMFYGAANIVKENDSFGSLFSNHSIPRVTIPRANQDRSYQGDTKTSFDFSPSSNDQSFSRGGPLPTDFLSGEVSPPSFLSRGEKFSY